MNNLGPNAEGSGAMDDILEHNVEGSGVVGIDEGLEPITSGAPMTASKLISGFMDGESLESISEYPNT
jgi:hypothetical protein